MLSVAELDLRIMRALANHHLSEQERLLRKMRVLVHEPSSGDNNIKADKLAAVSGLAINAAEFVRQLDRKPWLISEVLNDIQLKPPHKGSKNNGGTT